MEVKDLLYTCLKLGFRRSFPYLIGFFRISLYRSVKLYSGSKEELHAFSKNNDFSSCPLYLYANELVSSSTSNVFQREGDREMKCFMLS